MSGISHKLGLAGLLRVRASLKGGLWEPPEAGFGEFSMKVEYDADLEECVAASRQALKILDLVVTNGELHSIDARIDARSDLSDVLRITIVAPKEGGKTRVSFHAGREWTDDAREWVGKLRDAFERCLKNPAGKHL